MVEPVEKDTRGIVRPAAGLRKFRLDRFEPSPEVARFVDRYWLSSWHLPPGERHEQQVLVHPVINVVFDTDAREVVVSGVQRRTYTRVLEGHGSALGVMFRPGGFRPFLGEPVSTLTDKMVPLLDVLPELAEAMPEGDADERTAKQVDELLHELVPTEPQPCETTTAWAELAITDRSLHRVDQLAAAAGVGVRALQRAFQDHVGIGPKYVLRRYRLYEAGERAARDEDVDWGRLAADLGYADQAHLTREFTAAFGVPPGRYHRLN
ncbi:AraC family transcriptional regulator [Labedaea rhizosphaerae]|uniref:AraC family transcriptional regulator n=1 Tax=Labedaea rhizosphaerae TaxID=598644 RepID=A0A4R6S323_LABRH|nr:AraC family transcriptional regulator [Labedaea rhizosphaerae]TDP94010.1 AraC family transcriptional regulator [Labedaea rhizosphaerae]